MKKNYFFSKLILCGVFTLTTATAFVSCKDYDDDIDNLQSQIDANKSAIEKLQTAIDGGAVVLNTEPIEGGSRLNLSNGSHVDIMNGKDGKQGEQGLQGIQGVQGQQGIPGVTPKFRINSETNYWEVSLDNGETYSQVLDTAGNPVKATGATGPQGPEGPEGPQGPQGKPGLNGEDGASVDPDAIKNCISVDPVSGQIIIGSGENAIHTKFIVDDPKNPFIAENEATGTLDLTYEGVTYSLWKAGATLQSLVYVPEYDTKTIYNYYLVKGEGNKEETIAKSSSSLEFEVRPAAINVTEYTWSMPVIGVKTTKANSLGELLISEGSMKLEKNTLTFDYTPSVKLADGASYMTALIAKKVDPENADKVLQEISSEYIKFAYGKKNVSEIAIYQKDEKVESPLDYKVVYNDAKGTDIASGLIAMFETKAKSNANEAVTSLGFAAPTITVTPVKDNNANAKYYTVDGTTIKVKELGNAAAIGMEATYEIVFKIGNTQVGEKVIAKVTAERGSISADDSYDYGTFETNYGKALNKALAFDEIYKLADISATEWANDWANTVKFTATVKKDGKAVTTNAPALTFAKPATLTLSTQASDAVGTYEIEGTFELSKTRKYTVTAKVVIAYPFSFDPISKFRADNWWNTDGSLKVIGTEENNKFALQGDLSQAYKAKVNDLTLADYGAYQFELAKESKDNFEIASDGKTISFKADKVDFTKRAKVIVKFKYTAGALLEVETMEVAFEKPLMAPTASTIYLDSKNVDNDNAKLGNFITLKDFKNNTLWHPATTKADGGWNNGWVSYYSISKIEYSLDADAANYVTIDPLTTVTATGANPATTATFESTIKVKDNLSLAKPLDINVKVKVTTSIGVVVEGTVPVNVK
ncbi:PL29 family lyase N-terminal domain-containing protein [Parabacteroides pacaensis]|uniref:PL29 family lyase N-terminal domain-containing protein n=1 Tax=Parabacteroides pacaensis TaxID=2086575 RepID=UPI000D0FDCF2|nr:PL29 family lyase N-terminal domain-containing protein [Parabacteroides pacaensis]